MKTSVIRAFASDDGIRRFREEVRFRESGVWVVIELQRCFGLGILPAQFTNGVKDVLLGEETLLFQDLDQRGDFPHIGDGQFFEGADLVGVKVFGHEGTRM